MTPQAKKGLIGFEVPAATGEDFGHRILDYLPETDDFVVQPIKWSTGRSLGHPDDIDAFKLTYRYQVDKARKTGVTTTRRSTVQSSDPIEG
jgi:hypothetical protein